MREKKMSLILPAGIILVAGIIGFSIHLFSKQDDGATEELAEQVIEGQIESILNLPEGSRRGTVDLTPGSDENPDDLGEIANQKIKDAVERRKRLPKSTEMDE